MVANLRLARVLGATDLEAPLEYRVSSDDARAAQALMRECPAARWRVAVNLSSGRPAKNWPVASYAGLIEQLTRTPGGVAVVIVGGSDATEATRQLRERTTAPFVSLAGQTTVGTLAAVLAALDLYIGSEGGPMHLALAVATPVVAIHGPGDLDVFGPWAPAGQYTIVSRRVACSPCALPVCRHQSCLEGITVPEVVAAAMAMLENPRLPRRTSTHSGALTLTCQAGPRG